MVYTETAGQLAPEVEQEILRQILRERGIDISQLKKCVVRVGSHGRRVIEFDSDDCCTTDRAEEGLGKEFDRRRLTLPD